MGFILDPLGSVMLALVTTITLLVMIYSHGYMSHDPDRPATSDSFIKGGEISL